MLMAKKLFNLLEVNFYLEQNISYILSLHLSMDEVKSDRYLGQMYWHDGYWIYTHMGLTRKSPGRNDFCCLLQVFEDWWHNSKIHLLWNSWRFGGIQQQNSEKSEKGVWRTSFFNVLTKQSSVFLYVESPIILDFTYIQITHSLIPWKPKHSSM